MTNQQYKQTEIGDIPKDWDTKSLKDVLSFVVDNRGKTAPTAKSGIPLIATNCIKNENLYPVYEKVRYINQETYNNWFRSHPEPNDVIFVTKGTPGQACKTPSPVSFCIAQDMVALRVNESVMDPNFLLYAIRSPWTQSQINNKTVGTLIPHFKKGSFDRLTLPIPELDEQKEIASILSSLDDKIELNQKMNKTLEEIGKALFKRWFVDFEFPNNDGKPYKSNGGEMVDSELGKIPKGWKIETLDKNCNEIVRGFTTAYVEKSTLINLNQKVNRGELLDESNYKYYPENTAVPKNKFARKKDILINSLGQGTLGRVHLFWSFANNIVVDQHISIVRPNNKELTPEYTYYFLTLCFNLQSLITGSTGMLMLNISQVRSIKIPLPDHEIQKYFAEIVFSLKEKQSENNLEIKALSQIRDSLLPRLMSGKLRVN